MSQLPVATSELVGTFLEVLGYGVYLAVFPQCIAALRRKYASLSSITIVYFAATMGITFILITLHLVVDLTRAFQAFTANMDIGGAPEAYFATVDTDLNIAKNASYVSATLLADLLLIYRTFIVYTRNWWMLIAPLILFGVDFAMSVWFTWSVNEAHPGSSVLVSTVFDRSKYFFVATLALNWYCTIVIALRIWSIRRALSVTAALRLGSGYGALGIILESAAIYSIALVCLIGTSVSNSSALFFFLNSMPPLIGSVFSYVILRSTMDIKRFNTGDMSTVITNSEGNATIGHRRDRRFPKPTESEGVHIHLERVVHNGDGLVHKGSDMNYTKANDV